MPIVEYPAGATFPGVIGRTADESSPAWPAPTRPAKGAPNVLFVVLDDTGFGNLGCFGSPIATPNFDRIAGRRPALHQHAHDRALLAQPLLHHHRPQPPPQRHGRHHRARHPGIPGYNGIMPFENGMLSEMLLEHGYNTYMVGKWHLTPSNEETAAGPYTRWPLAPRLRALLRLPGWRHEPVVSRPGVRQPPGRAAADPGGGLPPHRGPRRQVDRVHHRRQADRPRQALLPVPLPSAPPTPRTTCPKEWADRYAGQFDDGWDAYRERTFARQKELGILPADAELSRHDPDVPDWDDAPGRGAPAVQPEDGGLRGLPEPHRPPPRPAARLPAGAGPARQHHRHGHLGQRRERRGRPDRAPPTRRSSSTTPRSRSRTASRSSTRSAARSTSTTTRGAGRGRATRPSGAGSARPTVAGRATRSSSPGRPASRRKGEVRTQYAHIIDMVPTVLDLLGIEPPRDDPGRDPGAARRASASRTPSTTPRPPAGTTPSTSRCSATAPSTTTAGARSARGRVPRSPRPAWASVSPSRPSGYPSSMPPAGSCTTSPRIRRRPTTSRRSTGTGSSR